MNILGEIIGINVAIYSPDTEDEGFVGIGFSIPSNDVREVFEQILAKGRATRGWLGVRCYDWNPLIREKVGWYESGGVYIQDIVPGSPAESSGLLPDDVVVRYNGKVVETRVQFFTQIQRTPVAREVDIMVWRNGEELTLKATVIDAEESETLTQVRGSSERSVSDQAVIREIGITVQGLTLLQRTRGGRGVLISGIHPEGQAARRGLRGGDMILEINNIRVDQPGEFYDKLISSALSQQTSLTVQRGRQVYRVRPFDQVRLLEKKE